MTTIHDVARRAGVSPVTVSRVINGAVNVNAITKEKVEQAIKDLGYVPNLAARSLRSRQTSTLALIVPDVTNAFWTTIARGVEDAAQAEGYSVLLCNTDESLSKQTGYINTVLRQRVDGVVIAPYDSDSRNLRQLNELKTPVVVLDRRVDDWEVDSVRSDSVAGAYALTQHLISLGHRRIAIISGPTVTSTAEERVAGYCLALQEAGIPVDPRLIRRGEYRARYGRTLTAQLIDEGLNPTAIFAANNVVGLGVLDELQTRGIRVPQDMALVCFDEMPDFARFYPFLTVVVQPAYDMGMNAAQLLLSRINAEKPLRPRSVILPNRLVLRYSCGRLLNQPETKDTYLVPLTDRSETVLIKPLQPERLKDLPVVSGLNLSLIHSGENGISCSRADVDRLRKALNHQETDRLPYIETTVTSKPVLEYVLERSLPYSQADLSSGRQALPAAELVEFAERVGMDAIPCEMNWLPGPLESSNLPDFVERILQACPPPSLTEHINKLEGFLRAAQGSRVGVYASFSSFFAAALRAGGVQDARYELMMVARRQALERLMDALLAYQEKVMRAVCDRFSADLAMVLVRDNIFGWQGINTQSLIFHDAILPRLSRLIAPAREHSLLVGISTPGGVTGALPALVDAGFGLFHPLDPDANDLRALRSRWGSGLVLTGGFPTRLLVSGTPEMIQAWVQKNYADQVKGGGLVVGSTEGITETVRPENYLALVRAVHRCRESA